MKSVTVNNLHGYGYLEEIMVRRADRQLYKFKEGDFVNLHLNDIEDMLLLDVQHKLFHLDGDVIVDLAVALQLYIPSFDPPGVVYADLSNRKKQMRADELYKFLYETLKKGRDTFRHKLLNFCFGYNKDMPRKKWSDSDKRRSCIMVDLIDKQMLERQILRNLERLVGARELEMDYKLMQRTCRPVKTSELYLSIHSDDGNPSRANIKQALRKTLEVDPISMGSLTRVSGHRKVEHELTTQSKRNSSSLNRVQFVNTITIIRKEDEPKEEEIIEPNVIKDNNHNTIVEIEEKVRGELSGFKTVIGEGELWDINRDDPYNRVCGDTKGVNEGDKESKELEEEVKEEGQEEEEDPKYFDTFPTVEELGYHEWHLKNPRPLWFNAK
ncbi:hypothetical protein Tco_1400205 [Tanacetum coccineum]